MIKPASKKDIVAVKDRVPFTIYDFQARAFIRLITADSMKLAAMSRMQVEDTIRRVIVYGEGVK